MRYVSTRGGGSPVTLSEAVERGLAPDGGLYVPERFPSLATDALDALVPAAPAANASS